MGSTVTLRTGWVMTLGGGGDAGGGLGGGEGAGGGEGGAGGLGGAGGGAGALGGAGGGDSISSASSPSSASRVSNTSLSDWPAGRRQRREARWEGAGAHGRFAGYPWLTCGASQRHQQQQQGACAAPHGLWLSLAGLHDGATAYGACGSLIPLPRSEMDCVQAGSARDGAGR